jgi:hypothetical protein
MKITDSFAIEATGENKKDPRWEVYVKWLNELDNEKCISFEIATHSHPFHGVLSNGIVSNEIHQEFDDILSLDEVFEKYNIPFSGKQMTEEQLLEKAKKDFPAGTTFETLLKRKRITVSENPKYKVNGAGSIEVTVRDAPETTVAPSRVIYSNSKDQWAKIIKSDESDDTIKEESFPKKPSRIQDLGKEDVVHCPTEREAKEILRLAHEQGLEWNSGYSFLDRPEWDTYSDKTCYILKAGQYCDLAFSKQAGIKVFPASDFLPAYFYEQTYTQTEGKIHGSWQFKPQIADIKYDISKLPDFLIQEKEMTIEDFVREYPVTFKETFKKSKKNTDLMKPLLLQSRKQEFKPLILAPINKPTK